MSKILCLLFLVVSCHSLVDVEKYFRVCDRNSPEVNDCLLEAIQDGLVKLADGIKDLGVPSIEPYHVKATVVNYNSNQISVKMLLKDVFLHGYSKNSKVHGVRLHAEDDKFHLEIDMTCTQLVSSGQYSADASYNALQILGSGEFNATMFDLKYTLKLDGTPEKIDNETYMRINKFYSRPDIGDLKVQMSNNNPETRELINLGVSFANENWKILYRELLPVIQDNWTKQGLRLSNKIFSKIPYNQLFPSKS